MSTSALDKLREAGAPVDQLPTAEREVFSNLSDHEVEVLSGIQARLNAVAADVSGQNVYNNFC